MRGVHRPSGGKQPKPHMKAQAGWPNHPIGHPLRRPIGRGKAVREPAERQEGRQAPRRPLEAKELTPVQLLQHGVDMLLGKLELAALGKGVHHLDLIAQVVAQAHRALGHFHRRPVVLQISVELAA